MQLQLPTQRWLRAHTTQLQLRHNRSQDMPQSRATGVNTPIPTSDMESGLWQVTGLPFTEVATTGSRRTKRIVDSRAREPSKLYSAEHDQTQVDTIITVIFAIIEITHETTSLDSSTHADSPVLLPILRFKIVAKMRNRS